MHTEFCLKDLYYPISKLLTRWEWRRLACVDRIRECRGRGGRQTWLTVHETTRLPEVPTWREKKAFTSGAERLRIHQVNPHFTSYTKINLRRPEMWLWNQKPLSCQQHFHNIEGRGRVLEQDAESNITKWKLMLDFVIMDLYLEHQRN